MSDNINQYVTFVVNEETYGMDVASVQEVTTFSKITHVPNTKKFMKGVLDLRGVVVPLVDMRLRFEYPEKKYDQNTVVVITQIASGLVGMIVDSVSDVISISSDQIQKPEHYSSNLDLDYVHGIYRTEKDLVIILNVDRILQKEDIEDLVALK